jgi:two-component system sensor histidine kinase PhcS
MPPKLAESVTNITRDVGEGVDRVVAIVSDLRTFAHPDQRSLHPVSVESVLSQTERFLTRDISDHNIQLSIQSSTGIQSITDDREILQVIINLLHNSIDALQERPKPTIQISCRQVGTIVQLSVTDNGTGITQDQASKIFDPFYTAKEVGKGMGLGLSICYRMMQQMEGDIEVESVAGEYTRFTLIFRSATVSPSPSTATSELTTTPA